MDGSMYRGIGDAIIALFIFLLILIPFAIWKLIDVIIWVIHHVSVTIK